MPELPEVEASRRLVQHNCLDRTISQAVVADDTKVFDNSSNEQLQKFLVGKKISAAGRKGKQMWLEFEGESRALLLHFGMTGSLKVEGVDSVTYVRLKPDEPGEWPPRFWKFHLQMEDGTRLAFCDGRRFGKVRLVEDVLGSADVSKLGWDALLALPALEELKAQLARFAKRSISIKALLLDQSFCAGIGNWVADEVLYQARLHPEQPVASLSEQQLAALHGAISSVLNLAVAVNADDTQYPRDWIFHYRWTGKKASSINGHAIDFITVGSRTSAYVPDLQKVTGASVKVVSSSGGKGKAAAKGKAKGKGRKKATESEEEESEESEEEASEEEQPKAKRQRGSKRATATATAAEPATAAAAAEAAAAAAASEGRGATVQQVAAGRKAKGKASATATATAAPAKRGKASKQAAAAGSDGQGGEEGQAAGGKAGSKRKAAGAAGEAQTGGKAAGRAKKGKAGPKAEEAAAGGSSEGAAA